MAGEESTWAVMLPVRPGFGTGYAAAVPTLDFRSDTVTRPTPEMRRAMAEAEVGDDVWGDDPTVIALEAEVAAMLGKEAAVYVPSGSHGEPDLGPLATPGPATRCSCTSRRHVVVHEQGGVAALAGVQPRMLPGAGGVLEPELLDLYLRDPSDPHHARQRLVWVENTVGELGGLVYPQTRLQAISAWAGEHGFALHMDGARIWNAAVATGIPPAEIAAAVDSVSVCFSKGLGAPVGSAVAGSAEFVEQARRNRKLFGGGMRQAGDDRCRRPVRAPKSRRPAGRGPPKRPCALALGLASSTRLVFDPDEVQTNIVLAAVPEGVDARGLVAELEGVGVLCADLSPRTVRFVTHLDVDSAAVEAALEAATPVLS